mmetsp:Transcript_34307/g.70245  ORF Transcript_34307/g.70245 Transcript_34307/m.70245 type:complete len:102 (-) Transcript_34307:936-1241(-)
MSDNDLATCRRHQQQQQHHRQRWQQATAAALKRLILYIPQKLLRKNQTTFFGADSVCEVNMSSAALSSGGNGNWRTVCFDTSSIPPMETGKRPPIDIMRSL